MKEYMRKYMNGYYQENKDKWSKKEICEECGREYTKSHKSEHTKTKRHRIITEKHRKNAESVLKKNVGLQ